MTSMPLSGVVLFVANVEKMARFYQAVTDWPVVVQDNEHAVLESSTFQLVIHALRGEPEPSKTADGQVIVRDDSYWKLCLPVNSIAAARTQASRLGGDVKPKSAEWTARGFRACDGHDPEGNVFQVRETA